MGAGSEGDWRQVDATFDVADDLLWQADKSLLRSRGKLIVERSGRIGPLVEMLLAARQDPCDYEQVSLCAPFCKSVESALSHRHIFGSTPHSNVGIFLLAAYPPRHADDSLRALWATRAEQAAARAGCSGTLPAQLLGAMGELVDNVRDRSGATETGLVAYAATDTSFEFVVADVGIGVLASIRQNPEFANLCDAGAALRAAASDGASRYGRTSGHGYGIGQVFRALASHNAELRFPSDDHSLCFSGDSPSLQGHTEWVQKGTLSGLTVSCCVYPSGLPRSAVLR